MGLSKAADHGTALQNPVKSCCTCMRIACQHSVAAPEFTSFCCCCKQVASVHSGAQVAMGGAHTVALGQAGTVSTWGSNHHGALGLGIGTSSDAHEPVRMPNLSCSQVSLIAVFKYIASRCALQGEMCNLRYSIRATAIVGYSEMYV